jgi:acetyl-CoA acyltransferase 1
MATLYAGLPEQTAVNTVNRQCSSGLQAVVQIATAIQSGLIEVGIGAGVESMTANYGAAAAVSNYSEEIVASCPAAADCLLPMGITSENVAKDFNVSRVKQDTFSALSHQRALAAQKAGLFDAEIVPVSVKTPEGKVTVTKDDGVREGVTAESLAKLKTVFSETGTTTAGNASQITDGAAAVLLMKRKTAQKLGLSILGKFVTSAVVGVPPKVMGIGPAFAIPAALKKAGITKDQVDIYEINEAFASQAVYCIEKLGLDPKKVNPKGGAIALGHPLGCTGARQIATILPELKRTGGKIGVTSMCIGSGMGMAAVIVSES